MLVNRLPLGTAHEQNIDGVILGAPTSRLFCFVFLA